MLARLQTIYVILNVLYVRPRLSMVPTCSYRVRSRALSLCMAVIIALPAATPKELMNDASFALGNFTNSASATSFLPLLLTPYLKVNGWTNGYAFILSFLAPLWTICSFDSSVHISEEAGNAATAVPWAIVNSIGIAGVLGWGTSLPFSLILTSVGIEGTGFSD